MVIAQHTHCVGCMEKYNSSTLVYGQGNFLFDDCDNEFWQTSLLINIKDDLSVTYIPIVKTQNTVRLAIDEEAKEILQDFDKRNKQIKNDNFIKKEYQSFADSMFNQYLYTMSPKWIVMRALNRLLKWRFMKWFVKTHFNEKQLTVMRNFIECEAHRELFLDGICNVAQGEED